MAEGGYILMMTVFCYGTWYEAVHILLPVHLACLPAMLPSGGTWEIFAWAFLLPVVLLGVHGNLLSCSACSSHSIFLFWLFLMTYILFSPIQYMLSTCCRYVIDDRCRVTTVTVTTVQFYFYIVYIVLLGW